MKKPPGDRGPRGRRAPRDDRGPRGDRGARGERPPARDDRGPRGPRGARGEGEAPPSPRPRRNPRRPWEAQPKRATPRPAAAETRPAARKPPHERPTERRRSDPEARQSPAASVTAPDRREHSRERRPVPPAAARAPRPPRRYIEPTIRPARGAARSDSAEARSRVATYRLLIEYEGTRYSGWQEQKNAPTVMGALRRAIQEAGLPILEMGGAGRTDAGVHALAQCAHLRFDQRFDTGDLCRALNKRLPRDIHVLGAEAADVAFHARHDAVARSYLYQISRRRTALAKPWVWWVRDALDVGLLRSTADLCVGRHDFRNFADIEPGSKESTIVEVDRVEVIEDGALIVVRIVASHFLWRMVRRLIGTLAQVAAGNLATDVFARLLTGMRPGPGDPRPAEWTAPPSGLFLERVLYSGDAPLGPPIPVVRVAAANTLVRSLPLRDTP